MAGDKSDFIVTNCKFEWKIKQFLSLPKGEITLSKVFRLSNNSLRIYIIPECINNVNSFKFGIKRESFDFYLPPLAISIGIKSARGSVVYSKDKLLKYRGLSRKKYLFVGFIDRALLLTSKDMYLPEGHLTLVFNCTLMDVPAFATKKTLPEKCDPVLVKNLEHLFLSEQKTDVVIKIKDKIFKSHQCILAARSDAFAAMFQQDMTEMEITDCDPDTFGDFLLYMYTGKTDKVTSENAVPLYTTADKYGVKDLKEKCAECMSLNLSIDSTCDVLEFASTHSDSDLLRSATEFFIKNMKEILQTEKWVDFHCKHFNLVTELFLKTAEFVKF